MSNRDQDRSRYDRNEGDDWRDQSNRGSRDWDRNNDDFRSQSYDRRDERLNSQGGSGYVGGSPYGDEDRSLSQRSPVSNWRDERTFSQHNDRFAQHNERSFAQRPSGSREWNRSVGSYNPDQGYGYGQDWGHARSSFMPNRDYGRDSGPSYRSGNFGRDDSFGSQTSSDSPYFGPRREESYFARRERDDWNQRPYTVTRSDWTGDYRRYNAGDDGRYGEQHENWGQQLREGMHQMADRVKRAFRGPKNYKRSDERIRDDVSDKLAARYDVDPTDIEVTVSSGEVTLTGTVQTRREKFLAEEIADDVGGVTEVHNQLRVRREGVQTTTGTQATGSGVNNGEGRNRNAPRA